ncbi:MAG TPA: hemerythrin domain-containing protein [Terracidiphilus sp.]|jgi:hemerythrin-like domain-containing protein|nr:hemerythrin domain-containing protein [Terracidiphilus sp.]
MAIQIGAKPDSGFDDPIGMLTDCHRRIEQFLKILATVAERAAGRGLTGEETAAVQSALHYFRTGGSRHTADEEESLFPKLRAESPAETFAKLDALEADHEAASTLHDSVEQIYVRWIDQGTLDGEAQQQLSASMNRMTRLYQAHIKVEESDVFPQAAAVLDRGTIASIGEEFRARRA